MAWAAPRTWTAGEFVTAAMFNAHVRDNLLETAVAKVTTAGDLVQASGANAVTRLATGANAVLRVNSGGSALTWSSLDDILRWVVSIGPYERSAGNTNWNTRSPLGSGTTYGEVLGSSGAQHDEVYWYVVLAAGTWTCRLNFQGDTGDQGIYSIRLDDIEVASIDPWTHGTSVHGIQADATGIVIATPGKKKMALKMASKNASSSGYFGRIRAIAWVRTA